MEKRSVIDQMGRSVDVPILPNRIVSLVPSQTELLFDLGLENQIVGITRFCVHPAKARQEKMVIGGTKKFDFDKIESLRPDLIIGNKEENFQEGIETLARQYPVWMSDIYTLSDSLDMMKQIGFVCGREQEASVIADEIGSSFQSLHPKKQSLKTAYLIWRKPYMAAASNTFIHHLMGRAGFENVFSDSERYPEVTAEELRIANPEVLMLSSEPYRFAEKHFDEFQNLLPKAKVVLVDGEMFSWYGSRLRHAAAYLQSLYESLSPLVCNEDDT